MNGEAERLIRTLKDCIRTVLLDSKLPTKYWDYALQDCTSKLNSVPKAGFKKSPHEIMFQKPYKLPVKIAFGSKGTVPNQMSALKSLAPRGIACRYLPPYSTDTIRVLADSNRKEILVCGKDFAPTTKINNEGTVSDLQGHNFKSSNKPAGAEIPTQKLSAELAFLIHQFLL